jgi:hypothetical protein
MNLDGLRAELRSVDADVMGDYVVFGSTVLLLHGLRLTVGDVDLFVRPWLYRALRDQLGWTELWPGEHDPPMLERHGVAPVPVHAFKAWQQRDPMVDASACFRFAEPHFGMPCIPLWLVRIHKLQALDIVTAMGMDPATTRWAKHIGDIAAIDARLAA